MISLPMALNVSVGDPDLADNLKDGLLWLPISGGCSSQWSLWYWECGRVPHMVGYQEAEKGHPQAGIPSRTGQTSHSTGSTASQVVPQLRTTMRSDKSLRRTFPI